MILIAKGKFSQPRGDAQIPEQQRPVPPQKSPYAAASTAAGVSKSRSASRAKTRKVLLISLCSVAVVLLIAVIIGVWFFLGWPTDDGLILNNVTVAGINLGGMTKEQASDALHRATDSTFTRQDMVVELPDTNLSFSPAETGAQLDVDAVIQAAYDYGRKGTYEEREQAKESSLSHYNEMNVLSMYALIGAYKEEGHQWLEELRQVLDENITFACDYIRDHFEGVSVTKPEGTYMLFVDCAGWCEKHGKTMDEVIKACHDVGVAVQDGRQFHGKSHLRMNLASPNSRIREAFDRLARYVFTP